MHDQIWAYKAGKPIPEEFQLATTDESYTSQVLQIFEGSCFSAAIWEGTEWAGFWQISWYTSSHNPLYARR